MVIRQILIFTKQGLLKTNIGRKNTAGRHTEEE